MYASYVQPSLLARMMNAIAYFLRSLSPIHGHKGTVYPNAYHLESSTRIFRSPSTAAEKFSRMLIADMYFTKALHSLSNNGEYLIQFAVCGDQLRANVYAVESDPSLSRIYDDKWFNNGIFSYHLMPNGEITQVLREMPGRFYHPHDVRMSYSLDLTTEQLMEIDGMRVHSL